MVERGALSLTGTSSSSSTMVGIYFNTTGTANVSAGGGSLNVTASSAGTALALYMSASGLNKIAATGSGLVILSDGGKVSSILTNATAAPSTQAIQSGLVEMRLASLTGGVGRDTGGYQVDAPKMSINAGGPRADTAAGAIGAGTGGAGTNNAGAAGDAGVAPARDEDARRWSRCGMHGKRRRSRGRSPRHWPAAEPGAQTRSAARSTTTYTCSAR
ncbi:MAG: hypothetical protein MO853_12095 [Candidatus Protistobacter heckmanni]|nr:hypothetical protein [Candidatus Protistobacter heckmanni]